MKLINVGLKIIYVDYNEQDLKDAWGIKENSEEENIGIKRRITDKRREELGLNKGPILPVRNWLKIRISLLSEVISNGYGYFSNRRKRSG